MVPTVLMHGNVIAGGDGLPSVSCSTHLGISIDYGVDTYNP